MGVASLSFKSGGEMAERVRDFDWSATPLGPADAWPQSLKTAVSLMLECQLPMYIAWGREFTQLYNDAYRPILGTKKHPQALGASAKHTWTEIWDTVGPMWEEVWQGKAVGFDDFKLTIERFGYPEDCYFNFSFSPARDDAGKVAGVLVTFAETTERVLSERRVSEERERLHSLFMQVPAAIAIVRGADMLFELANPHYEKLVARSAQQLIGHSVLDVFPEAAPELRRTLHDVLQGQRITASELPIALDWTGNGEVETRRLNLVYEPYRDETGAVDGFIAFAVDVTDQFDARKAVEAADARTRFAMDAAGMGEWELNLETGQAYRSLRHDQCFGYQELRPNWSYEDFLRHVLPEDRAAVGQSFEDALAGRGDWRFECRVVWPDQSIHWITSRGRVERDAAGKPVRMAGLVWDITDIRRAHEALREADRRKDEFLATLAHELRNPLGPIRQAALIGRAATATDAQRRWSHEVIERQVKQMSHLLEDLLDVSRITRGKLNLRKERIDLAAVIDLAIETSRPQTDARGQHVHVQLPNQSVHIFGDAVRLAQVLSNLLSNAAKYSAAGSDIELRADEQDGEAVIQVRDQGMGIPGDQLSRVFDMFWQASGLLERADGGLGIGLALVKGLVELHGGSVEARSEGPNRGSEFIVRLPSMVESHAAVDGASDASGASAAGTGRRVLVVDDNRDAADSLAMLLSLEGHEVKTVHSGEVALQVGPSYAPEVVLLDIGMPGMNGYEVARRIRAKPWKKSLMLVAVTGWGQAEDKRRALEAGFDDHMTKPVDPAMLSLLLASSRT